MVDEIEQIAIDRLCELFGASYANVQPHSGSNANMAVYFGLIKLGDTVVVFAQGPIAVALPIGGPLQLHWSGPANQGYVLASAPLLIPGQRLLGAAVVDLDLATTTSLFGVFDPLWGGLFVTDAQGTANQSFAVPAALHGSNLNVQGLLLDAGTTCSFGFLTTASFAVAL